MIKSDCSKCFNLNCQFHGGENRFTTMECLGFIEYWERWKRGESLYVWYCEKCGHQVLDEKPPIQCPNCGMYLDRSEVK